MSSAAAKASTEPPQVTLRRTFSLSPSNAEPEAHVVDVKSGDEVSGDATKDASGEATDARSNYCRSALLCYVLRELPNTFRCPDTRQGQVARVFTQSLLVLVRLRQPPLASTSTPPLHYVAHALPDWAAGRVCCSAWHPANDNMLIVATSTGRFLVGFPVGRREDTYRIKDILEEPFNTC